MHSAKMATHRHTKGDHSYINIRNLVSSKNFLQVIPSFFSRFAKTIDAQTKDHKI